MCGVSEAISDPADPSRHVDDGAGCDGRDQIQNRLAISQIHALTVADDVVGQLLADGLERLLEGGQVGVRRAVGE